MDAKKPNKLTKQQAKEYDELLSDIRRPKGRDYTNVSVTGRRRRGKSTLLALLVKRIHAKFNAAGRQRKILIVDLAPAKAFEDFQSFAAIKDLKRALALPIGHEDKWTDGIRKIKPHLGDMKEFVEVLVAYFRNGAIVWDEANQFLERNGGLPDWQLPIFSANGNMAIDNFICTHRLMDIPKAIRTHIESFIIFAVDDPFTSAKDLAAAAFPGPHQEFFDTIQRAKNSLFNEDSRIKHYEVFNVN